MGRIITGTLEPRSQTRSIWYGCMQREIGFDQISRDPNAVVTVGTFDGVHKGHQTILSYVKKHARMVDGTSTLVTFDPHPRTVLRGESVPLLTSIEERAAAVETLGIERFVVIPFTEEFSQLAAEAFVRELLLDRIGCQAVVIGYDHRFGRGGEGDVDTMRQLGERHGFSVEVIPAQALDDEVVSSSALRKLLLEGGDVETAKRMLGRPYRIHGEVVEGDGRGKSIGYPTANLAVDRAQKVIPSRGVYAVRSMRVDHPEQPEYGGMMNIGFRPTFTDEETLVPEVHLFDCSDEFYGETLRVDFLERIRDEISFGSVEELIEQLERDERRCKEALGVIS